MPLRRYIDMLMRVSFNASLLPLAIEAKPRRREQTTGPIELVV